MATKDTQAKSEGSTVTVDRSGARSVDLGKVLNTDRALEQLRQIQKIQDRQTDQSRNNGAVSR